MTEISEKSKKIEKIEKIDKKMQKNRKIASQRIKPTRLSEKCGINFRPPAARLAMLRLDKRSSATTQASNSTCPSIPDQSRRGYLLGPMRLFFHAVNDKFENSCAIFMLLKKERLPSF